MISFGSEKEFEILKVFCLQRKYENFYSVKILDVFFNNCILLKQSDVELFCQLEDLVFNLSIVAQNQTSKIGKKINLNYFQKLTLLLRPKLEVVHREN